MLRKKVAAVLGLSFMFIFLLSAENQGSLGSQDVWFNAEVLYWKTKNSPKMIPLVTKGTAVSSGAAVLKSSGSKVILGGKKIENNFRSGGRFSLGGWVDEERLLGLEANYFFLPQQAKKRSVVSSGSLDSPFFAVPFFNVLTNEESSSPLALPGVFAGKAKLKESNRMQGAEVNAMTVLDCFPKLSLGLLSGFRFWNFVQQVSFETDSPFVSPSFKDIYQTEDQFCVKNKFYGGQVGVKLEYDFCPFFFNVNGKVALGGMRQVSNIKGVLFTDKFNQFKAPLKYRGGYFALLTNQGQHKAWQFSLIPEANINIGYRWTECVQLYFGYTFIYASQVLFATNQVSRSINPTQSVVFENNPDPVLEGEHSPKASLKAEGLWVQGLSAGFEYRF